MLLDGCLNVRPSNYHAIANSISLAQNSIIAFVVFRFVSFLTNRSFFVSFCLVQASIANLFGTYNTGQNWVDVRVVSQDWRRIANTNRSKYENKTDQIPS